MIKAFTCLIGILFSLSLYAQECSIELVNLHAEVDSLALDTKDILRSFEKLEFGSAVFDNVEFVHHKISMSDANAYELELHSGIFLLEGSFRFSKISQHYWLNHWHGFKLATLESVTSNNVNLVIGDTFIITNRDFLFAHTPGVEINKKKINIHLGFGPSVGGDLSSPRKTEIGVGGLAKLRLSFK